jgi:anaerobic magnesium-protoporphyrin IX monomethyl ester cyclase
MLINNISMDVIFLIPPVTKTTYQDLRDDYSANEPPTWALLLAEACRSKGFIVGIIDMNAEKLSYEDTYLRIKSLNPRLLCFVAYGQNVNAGTTTMGAVSDLSKYLKKKISNLISVIGSHVQALPIQTLNKETSIDFVFTNEGVYSLQNILKLETIDLNSISNIKGIALRKNSKVFINPPERLVPQNKLDEDLPGYAWDLLPYKSKPLDLYRSPMWHANYDENKRSPYAAIQTSIGCQFQCEFCMINIVNRTDDNPIGVSSDYNGMRYWSREFIIKEFDKLIEMGVKTIKITDEMFLLNPKFYLPLCEMLERRNKNDELILWAYSRVDTVKNPEVLKKVRKAGIKWLALGIENANLKIRLETSKGKFQDVDIKRVIKQIHESGINVMANYMYGLPGETHKTINDTFKLSKELCTLGWNCYAAMALPGSKLYKNALEKGIKLPETYEAFSFLSYDTINLSTKHLEAAEILNLRDQHYIKYHNNKKFLEKVKNTFGEKAMRNIKKMTKIKLRRKIIENFNNI